MVMNCHKIWSDIKLVPSCISFHTYFIKFHFPLSLYSFCGSKTADTNELVFTSELKTTGHEKTRFTVVLACLADGTKLKPMVIFKQKTMLKDNFPTGVGVHNHPKGWMDESGVKIWIEKVWRAPKVYLFGTRSVPTSLIP